MRTTLILALSTAAMLTTGAWSAENEGSSKPAVEARDDAEKGNAKVDTKVDAKIDVNRDRLTENRDVRVDMDRHADRDRDWDRDNRERPLNTEYHNEEFVNTNVDSQDQFISNDRYAPGWTTNNAGTKPAVQYRLNREHAQ